MLNYDLAVVGGGPAAMAAALKAREEGIDKIVEAGETMNHYSIHSLVVIDDSSRVCGVIDSFSCLPGTRFYH